MPHLVAAPDKFKGTAGAPEVAGAAARAAAECGWTADAVPVADGGEGLLEALGGSARRTPVTGPDGRPVVAEWRWREAGADGNGPTAVIEMARAAGLQLAGGSERNDPLAATTTGVGQLILAAVESGARRVVVGCGGSATTDGGLGAVEAIGSTERLEGVELLVACDVTSTFVAAAPVFGPQKGASPAQILLLEDRLRQVADHYRTRFGVDVLDRPGSGAAGGLAGGLVALGGRIVGGFDLVSELQCLPERLHRADLVVTGEGRFDASSLQGKVVGSVLGLVAPRTPVLCIVGATTAGGLRALDEWMADRGSDSPRVELVGLVGLVGWERAHREVGALVAGLVAERCRSGPPETHDAEPVTELRS